MAEVTATEKICQKCGAEVRPNTAFCYNCGFPVAPVEGGSFPTVKDKLREEEIKREIAADKNSAVVKDEKLQSAAALREKRLPVKRTNEIIWEEPQSAPNVWFLAVAFLLTAFAVAVFVAMLYLK